ncbi:MAG: dihydroneopterin aldolase [SAR86 cluster bacterium]|uniref:7,8-dihydroneopterin aldolase n=1 Tax=SAR86 cluster bacterium TaxID=2030880 RepID=A0A2A5CE39_9GAMM|nr:dihydroneopterin aldolase [Gammaproteobacteria bacterium AH-315-E17]PCJ41730.1 MAG: dihydroneopterin aldolase [SAR86 cluster bacterium]
MDIVYIRGLEVKTVIGIYDWEKAIKQKITIDIEMASDIKKAAASDEISDALDYKSVSKRLISFVEESEIQLIETLAEKISEIVLSEFDVSWLKLSLGKPGAVTGSRDVGVIIERGVKQS